MPPLLYIILLSAVLFIMLYWVLSAAGPEEHRSRFKMPSQDMFSWESAQELFKYLETEEFYLPADSIKLLAIDSGHLRAYWRISQSKWQEILKQLGNRASGRELILRLHQDGKTLDLPDASVKRPVGSYDWEIEAESSYYVSLGITGNDYTPLIISDKL
jgi:hypothetical protein